jgi:4-hydroxybenzoate polyprenyltransferase
MWKKFDFFFVLRPVLMPPVWTILLLGYHRAPFNYAVPTYLLFILIFFLVGAIYLLNQIFDIESDRINKKLFFLSEGYISKKSALIETVFLNFLSIIPAYFISWRLGILFSLGLMLGFFYSVPPWAFKNRPYLGFFSNAFGHGSLIFLIGWSGKDFISAQTLFFSLPYFFAVGAVYLNTTFPDREGDKKISKSTLAVKWNARKVLLLSTILVFLAIISSLFLGDFPFLIASLFCFPFFIHMNFRLTEKSAILASKVAVLFLSLVACYFFLWYLAILVFGFFITRKYYEKRFKIKYPNLEH